MTRQPALWMAALLVALALGGPLLSITLVRPSSGLAQVDGPPVAFPPGLHVAGYPTSLRYASFEGLDPQRDALLVISPEVAFGDAEASALLRFLHAGGRILIADDTPIGQALLHRLTAGLELTGTHVYSPSFRGDARNLLAVSTGAVPNLPMEVQTTHPVLVRGGTAILRPPSLSWEDLNDNGRPDIREPLATGSVAAMARVGEGQLIVLGDPDLIVAGEEAVLSPFLMLLTAGQRRLVVDASHEGYSDPLGFNRLLAGGLSAAAASVILMSAAAVGAAIVLGPRLRRIPDRGLPRMHTAGVSPALLSETLQELDPK